MSKSLSTSRNTTNKYKITKKNYFFLQMEYHIGFFFITLQAEKIENRYLQLQK